PVLATAGSFSGQPFHLFDFFCGPGEETTGEPGSALILIDELLAERTKINERVHDIRISFNDQNSAKIDSLKQLCGKKSLPCQPRFECLDFADAFKKLKSE